MNLRSIIFYSTLLRVKADSLSLPNSLYLPRVSVITVVKNDINGLARTLDSIKVQDYTNFQMVVIDGGSTDGTLKLLGQYAAAIDSFITEPDEGIYHAMNKGVKMADGEWLLFMNAGDEFVGSNTLSFAVAATAPELDVVYSDWIYREDSQLAKADLAQMNVRHQSVMYRKSLHELFGLYAVGKGLTISDFLFFLSISNRRWAYCTRPISLCDKAGASGKPKHFYQRMAVELMFGYRSRVGVAIILLLYPMYSFMRRYLGLKR